MMRTKEQQINLFDEIEKTEREDAMFREKEAMYSEWQKLPEVIFIPEDSAERANINDILYHGYCKLYIQALHVCEELPDNHYIWLNCNQRDFWVLNEKGECGGELVKTCPYCGAKLAEGKGNVTLHKAPAKYWLFFLHFDIPMRTLGYQPKEDREKIKAVWG